MPEDNTKVLEQIPEGYEIVPTGNRESKGNQPRRAFTAGDFFTSPELSKSMDKSSDAYKKETQDSGESAYIDEFLVPDESSLFSSHKPKHISRCPAESIMSRTNLKRILSPDAASKMDEAKLAFQKRLQARRSAGGRSSLADRRSDHKIPKSRKNDKPLTTKSRGLLQVGAPPRLRYDTSCFSGPYAKSIPTCD